MATRNSTCTLQGPCADHVGSPYDRVQLRGGQVKPSEVENGIGRLVSQIRKLSMAFASGCLLQAAFPLRSCFLVLLLET
jgi:hypothetical protein